MTEQLSGLVGTGLMRLIHCLCRDKYSPKLEPDKRILDYELEILRDAENFLHLDSEETSKEICQIYKKALNICILVCRLSIAIFNE